MSPLGFQGFDAAGLLYKGEAPTTFFPGFPMRVNRGKGEWTDRLPNEYPSYSYKFLLVFTVASVDSVIELWAKTEHAARYFVKHWARLFPKFWVSGTLFYID
ncbi:unnamed protein product [Prunus armeniaca]